MITIIMLMTLVTAAGACFLAAVTRHVCGEQERAAQEGARRESEAALRVQERDARRAVKVLAREQEAHARWARAIARKSLPDAVDATARLAVLREEARRRLRKGRIP